MKEIRIHGRGGQGSLVLAQFMAIAALEDKKYGQAFPFLGGGGERRGKPIVAYCRLDARPIRVRSRVAAPDYVIVQDPSILGEMDVAEGLAPDGMLLVNTDRRPEELPAIGALPRVWTVAGDQMARRILGRPIANAALLGAFAGLTGELSLTALNRAVRAKFPGDLGEQNAQLAAEAYGQMKEKVFL